LSDTNENEGFFAIKGSHIKSPLSFLRKVHCEESTPTKLLSENLDESASEDEKPTNTITWSGKKCVMLPENMLLTDTNLSSAECIKMKKGDVLAYHGNLSYYLNCVKEGNNLLFLHLVEGRRTKWEHDNVCEQPSEILFGVSSIFLF